MPADILILTDSFENWYRAQHIKDSWQGVNFLRKKWQLCLLLLITMLITE
jgi:hypothetical protein